MIKYVKIYAIAFIQLNKLTDFILNKGCYQLFDQEE